MANHKGPKFEPKSRLYHKSNPKFRELIGEQGLTLQKGESYSIHSPEAPPAIFVYFGDIDYYDSTYDDDIWEIDHKKIDQEFFIDLEICGDIQQALVTYKPIPREAIKLIYEGTGGDSF